MKKFLIVSLTILALLSMTVVASADSTTIYSDTSVMTYQVLDAYAPLVDPAWGSASPAVVTWKHPSWPTLGSAAWISNTVLIQGNVAGNTWRRFSKSIDLCSGAYDIEGTIRATADNAEEVYVNGVLKGSDGEVQGAYVDNQEWSTITSYYFLESANKLTFDFIVRNYPGSSDPNSNPTGLIFDATVNYSCPVEVAIDIKPGSDPSCFNNDGNGVIPVAVLGSETFDVNNVNVATVNLAGLAVAVKGKADTLQAAYEDVNLDGYMDLVVKIVDVDGTFAKGSGFATLKGFLQDGTPFFGTGDICITQ